jgi:hypothetical protein
MGDFSGLKHIHDGLFDVLMEKQALVASYHKVFIANGNTFTVNTSRRGTK